MYFRICLLAVLPLVSAAQEPSTTPHATVRGTNLSVASSPIDLPIIPDSPFSATVVAEINESKADGTSMATKTIAVIARDSKGRTYVKNHYPLTPSDTGNGRIRSITISDPIAQNRTELHPATMQATTFNLPASVGPPSTPPRIAADDEDLGMSTMEGLSVHGYRHSTTMRLNPPIIQHEAIGSGTQAMKFTNEYWFSDQLQMSVMTKTETTGGRGQIRSQTLTQVSLNEPEPALFQIPSEYKLVNVQHAVQISGKIAEANLIAHVDPTYPSLAKAARVQGTVEFTATIESDGIIKNLQLVRGHPLLDNAAKEALLQWKYRPTLLNGEPVSVIAPVFVSFTLPDQN